MKHVPARKRRFPWQVLAFELVGQGAFECFDALEADGYLD
jgi:hypothetical protein